MLLLVRHGETSHNAARRYQGHLDIPLNSRGEAQAARVAQTLATYFSQGRHQRSLGWIDFVSSDLQRAQHTAEIIKRHLQEHSIEPPQAEKTPRLTEELREFHMGDLQGLTHEQYETKHSREWRSFSKAFREDPLETPYPGPGGESQRQVQNRMLNVWQQTEERFLSHAQTTTTNQETSESHSFSQASPSRLWHDRSLWVGSPTALWVSHGGAMRMLLAAWGVSLPPEAHIGNADCLVLGKLPGREEFALLHHVKT